MRYREPLILRLILENIAHTPHGSYQRTVGVAVDLVAQPVYVDVHDVGGGVEAHLPDVVEDHAAGDDAAGIAAEVLEEGKLLLGELQFGAAAVGFAPDEIELEVCDAKAGGFRLVRRAAPEKRTQAGNDFCDSEGLGEVVIASALEAKNALVDGTARGEDEHGCTDSLGTQAMDQVKAIHVGQREVDDHRVVHAFDRLTLRFAAGRTRVDPEPSLGEGAGKKFTNCPIVLDYKQPQSEPGSPFLYPDGAASKFQRILPKAFG